MCRAEITQEDCTKVKETVSTITHRREVDLKQRKKEKETMERKQLKKQQFERQARLKQEKEERGAIRTDARADDIQTNAISWSLYFSWRWRSHTATIDRSLGRKRISNCVRN